MVGRAGAWFQELVGSLLPLLLQLLPLLLGLLARAFGWYFHLALAVARIAAISTIKTLGR